jgi:hypothetical protein
LVFRGHYHENVHVAVGVRYSIGVGAKKNNFVRAKLIRNLPGKIAYDGMGNVCSTVPCRGFYRFIWIKFFAHDGILA